MSLNLKNFNRSDSTKVIPFDQDSPEGRKLLKDLQGNILKGHGRHYAAHMFIQFGPVPIQARKWVKKFSANITSALAQRKESLARRKAMELGMPWKERTFFTFVLSAKGYEALEIPKGGIPGDSKFRQGMEASGRDLKDPSRDKWEAPYQENCHAMIVIAHQDGLTLQTELLKVREFIQHTRGAFIELTTELGRVLQNDHNDVVEHFGYIDGRSQPLFLKKDVESQKRREGIAQYDPSTPLDVVLVQEPNGGKRDRTFGSYLVFRKLEQNVKGFKEREEQLAKALNLDDEERAGALVVGRFEDGTPVTLQHGGGMHQPIFNNFNYENDKKGSKCPIQGHIRKVNPRSVTAKERIKERKHRITRRGITYGKRKRDLSDQPETGVGLLFMCFQANIANQFEHLQVRANTTTRNLGGLDPIIGQTGKTKPSKQHWPSDWADDGGKTKPFDFRGFVTLKGGEYFFAPSLPFLRNLPFFPG